jgi:hypothetical protein
MNGQKGFFFRRSPVREHGVLYFIDQGQRPDNGLKTVFAPKDQRILTFFWRTLSERGLDFCSIGLNFKVKDWVKE